MKKSIFLFLAMLSFVLSASSKDIKVETFRYIGPMALMQPIVVDSTNVKAEKFNISSLLDGSIRSDIAASGRVFSSAEALSSGSSYALHLLQASVDNVAFTTATVKVEGLKNYRLLVDDAASDGNNVSLMPGTHTLTVKCLTEPDSVEHISMTITTADSSLLSINSNSRHLYTINNVTDGERLRDVKMSASGRYMITTRSESYGNGQAQWKYQLVDMQTMKVLRTSDSPMTWLAGEDRYYQTRKGSRGTQLVAVDPKSGDQTVLCEQVPSEYYIVMPLETGKLLVTHSEEGPKDDADVHEYIHPDDRQPGWRNRYSLQLYDMATGITQPLTYGHRNIYANDITADGRYILATITQSMLGERPTERTTMLRIDLKTMQTVTIAEKDGFINSGKFSPDGRKAVVMGSPEAFGGIGKNVPAGRIPNMYDYQLFIVDIASGAVTPITKTFNPSIEKFVWNASDGNIYFTANDRDRVNLFRCLPQKNYKIERIDVPEEVVTHIDFAEKAPVAAYIGESASNSDRLYTLNLKTMRSQTIEDLSAKRLKDVVLGECLAWDYVNSKGDTICGRYYLPPYFDSTKKYPMIVYYYGGCSPVPRNFETRYPFHTYAAQGYVVYVLQPSGCAGFGQEFSSRHVNTAGQGPAEDIIEGTKQFVSEHPFVDSSKIGCMGASYGGFMTQYLQTQTDIFAAAISHAGISDHTSYWGEGYWGYTYSEVSMAESYPWTRKDLFVDQSPLYNADKIHTPLLFLHGTADTNVPIGESIQMYTALKLLKVPTALVVVEGENHGINEYSKRMKWQQTIYAWFAKWLKDDSSWWNKMYPEKNI